MRFSITALLAAVAVASPIADVMEGRNPNPKDVSIKSFSMSGTGCPPGTVSYDIGEEATLLALTYSAYEAATGPGKTITDARKFCNVRIALNYPKGWSYTVAKTVIRGYVDVPQTCSAKLSALYYFSGNDDDATSSVRFTGPTTRRYKETASVGALVWSRCNVAGPLFNVNTDASVQCNKAAVLGVDTQDTKFALQLFINWRRC